jgi:hypothetical protein
MIILKPFRDAVVVQKIKNVISKNYLIPLRIDDPSDINKRTGLPASS